MCFSWLRTTHGQDPQSETFPDQGEVLTLLRDRCLTCHNDRKAEGGYNMARIKGLLQAGDSGAKPIVFGDANGSELFQRLVSDDDAVRMPSQAPKLSDLEIAKIHRWIQSTHSNVEDEETPIIDLIGGKDKLLNTTGEPTVASYSRGVPVPIMALDSNTNRLYSGGVGEVIVWDATERRILERWTGFGRHISSIQVHSTGNWVAIASGQPSRNGTVHVVDTSQPGVARVVSNLGDVPVALAFSPNATVLAIGCLDGTLKLFDVLLHRSLMDVSAHADQVLAVAWKPDGTQFISGSRDRTARVYEFPSMELKVAYSGHERAIGAVGLSDFGALTLDETGSLRLWANGDSDRVLTKRTGLPQRLQAISNFKDAVTWLEEAKIVSASIQRREEDQGKDQEGKPKTKTIHEFRVDHSASLPSIPIAAWTFNAKLDEHWFVTRDGWLSHRKEKRQHRSRDLGLDRSLAYLSLRIESTYVHHID